MTKPVSAFVGIGSNMHQPVRQVRSAIDDVAKLSGVTLLAQSSLYRTAPIGYDDQPWFINAVVQLSVSVDPEILLASLLDIETRKGRVRLISNGPRVLDLDLLLYADARIAKDHLVLPHPRLHERAFVLHPLLEIAPDVCIPGLGSAEVLAGALGRQGIEKLDNPANEFNMRVPAPLPTL